MKFSLFNPDARRWVRTIVQAILVLALLWYLRDLLDLLKTEDGLREFGKWCFALLAIGTLGYQVENGVRSFKVAAPGGASFEVDGGEPSTTTTITATASATVPAPTGDQT